MSGCTVVVATFGGATWRNLAYTRAIPSARAQGVAVVYAHGSTLAQARNAGLARVETEWVVHLDADDELEDGYVDRLLAGGGADVRAPSVRYVRGAHARWPAMPRVAGHMHECVGDCLPHGNWLVVGAMARAGLLRRVGGWEDFPWSEDWAMWLRCYRAGASFSAVPEAVYRAHSRPGSRNRSLSAVGRNRVHHQILAAVYPDGVPV